MIPKVSITSQQVKSVRTESKFNYQWTLPDFDCKTASITEHLPAIKFEFKLNPGLCLNARISLEGDDCRYRRCRVELESLSLRNWRVSCTMYVNSYKYIADFSHELGTKMQELFLEQSGCLLSNRTNMISLEIKHVEYIQKPPPFLSEVKKSKSSNFLLELFHSKLLYDVTFLVGESKFLAHKCILVSRSPTFRDMFIHKGKDTEIHKVIIDDMEPEVFNELLRFVYTDEVKNLKEMSLELFVASNKYGLERLKSMCENELAKNLAIGNAIEIAICADSNGASDLKDHAIRFIAIHSQEIVNTPEWQKIVEGKPHLLVELYNQTIDK